MSTDFKRWGDRDSFKNAWNKRTELLAAMIPAEAKTVLEFGAGVCYLEDLLRPDQVYTPSDLVSRGDGTIVYDLNETPYSFIESRYDVVVLSGVFEYLVSIPELVQYLSTFTGVVVCSYGNTSVNRERSIGNGWVNFYTQQQFQNIFTNVGFKLESEGKWQNQSLYTFTLRGK